MGELLPLSRREQTRLKKEYRQYKGLEQYPQALEYLAFLGVSADDLTAVYPEFEEYAENEFDDHGHAFRYVHSSDQSTRLDRVLFPAASQNPYILTVDRQERYIVPGRNTLGVYTKPRRRMRLDVYPDQSIALQLQCATSAHLTDMATYFIDAEGMVLPSDLAMRNSKHLNISRDYGPNRIAVPVSSISDEGLAHRLMYFSEEFLEEGWGLTEQDIAIPSAELTRKILTAPVEKGINLREMLLM